MLIKLTLSENPLQLPVDLPHFPKRESFCETHPCEHFQLFRANNAATSCTSPKPFNMISLVALVERRILLIVVVLPYSLQKIQPCLTCKAKDLTSCRPDSRTPCTETFFVLLYLMLSWIAQKMSGEALLPAALSSEPDTTKIHLLYVDIKLKTSERNWKYVSQPFS